LRAGLRREEGFFLSSFRGAEAPLFHQKARNLKNLLAQKALIVVQFGFWEGKRKVLRSYSQAEENACSFYGPQDDEI
jgi:hypothetical protein